jgi:predicted amidohydrolase YtcJ
MKRPVASFLFAAALPFLAACSTKDHADLVLRNAEVYTMDPAHPWARAVVVSGNEITAVLDHDADVDAYVGPGTRVVDLAGQLVLPGFIDAHTHMGGFSAQQHDIDLMPVSDEDGLVDEVARMVGLLDEGEWITGGRWDGHRIWQMDWREREALLESRWEPDRSMIDPASPANPVFVFSYDRALYLANTEALRAAGLEDEPVGGMRLDAEGRPTGLIYAGSPAIQRLAEAVTPKSEARILDELRAGLRVMAERGITEIHDLASERQMGRYAQLAETGDLTVRIWGRPHIPESAAYEERGLDMGTHPVTGEPDGYLRIGGYKAHYDGLMGSHGALLYEPYRDRPDTHGRYRDDTSDDPDYIVKSPDKFLDMALIAERDGYSIDTHAIGSRGVGELLDDYERLRERAGGELNRFRVIHAEVVRPDDFARFHALGLIAEVNPSQMEDDMRWVQDRLGPERERLVFPFRTFLDAGVRLAFGSDIPGAAGADFSNHPALALHFAVHRTNTSLEPSGGWIPEQAITVHEALEAFTVNGAYAVFDEDVRGTLTPGKLADIAVASADFVRNPDQILDMEIVMTVVDGRIVFER